MDVWGEAEAILRSEDHYLLVLIDADAKFVTSPKSDRLKLIATAGVVTFIVLALFYFFTTK